MRKEWSNGLEKLLCEYNVFLPSGSIILTLLEVMYLNRGEEVYVCVWWIYQWLQTDTVHSHNTPLWQTRKICWCPVKADNCELFQGFWLGIYLPLLSGWPQLTSCLERLTGWVSRAPCCPHNAVCHMGLLRPLKHLSSWPCSVGSTATSSASFFPINLSTLNLSNRLYVHTYFLFSLSSFSCVPSSSTPTILLPVQNWLQ